MKMIRRLTLAGLLACALPLTLHAAPPVADGTDSAARKPLRASFKEEGGMMRQGMLPGLRNIDLSDAQRDQVFSLMHEQAPRMREAAKAKMKAHEAMLKLSAADTYDAVAARRQADELAKTEVEMTLLRTEVDVKVRQLLTPEQRKQFDNNLSQMGSMHGGGMREGGRMGAGRDGEARGGCRQG